MAWWNDFKSSITSIPTVLKTATGGSPYLSEEERKKEELFFNNVKSGLASVDAALNLNPVTKAAKDVAKKSGDLLLQGAVNLNNNVISPYITRPISTLALVTDINSPLYKKGQYEEGFQFKDIQAAYNRSAKVSIGQALTKSELTPISMLASMVLPAGGIDMDAVDLWDDQSVKKNFVDNAVGRWFTGLTDFFVGNKVFGVAAKATVAGVRAGAKPVGLYTKTKTVDELATDMQNGITHAKTNGAQGSPTVSGSHILTMAESKDWGVVTDLVTKYSTNAKLIDIIHDATDPEFVKDMILADKGNVAALERVAQSAPHQLAIASNLQGQLKNIALQTGRPFTPTGVGAQRLQSVWDAAVKADPQVRKIRDAFFDDNYALTPGGRAYNPLEPKGLLKPFASTIIKAEDKVRDLTSSMRFREQSMFAETSLGGNLAMKAIRLTGRGTELMPEGFVTFSGIRPLQGRVELNAFLNNLKLFREGNRMILTSPTGVTEKAADVRRRFEDAYMRSLGKNEAQVLDEIDAEVGRLLAYDRGIYDDAEIAGWVKTFRSNTTAGIESVKQNGFGIAHDGTAMIVQPNTLRQLVDSYRFTPWDDIEREIDTRIELSRGKAAVKGAQISAREVFNDLNRVWTFDVLARPSYIVKQSLMEPIISTTIAHGIGFTWKALLHPRTGALTNMAAKNASLKVKDMASSVVNKSELKVINKELEAKNQALQMAVANKNIVQASLEDLLTNASPFTRAQHAEIVRKELAAAEAIVDEIELSIRGSVVPYGKKEAIPSMATLERRIAFLDSNPNIAKNNPDIAAAKASIANYKNLINKLATNKTVIQDADKAVADAYARIDSIVKDLPDVLQRRADVFGKSADFKKRYYAEEKQDVIIDGKVYSINSFIQDVDGQTFSNAANRAEAQNARTTDINWMSELSTGLRKSLIERKGPSVDRISVTHPLYFEELAYIANRHYRGEPLMDLILAETPSGDLAKWATSKAGQDYYNILESRGLISSPKEYPSYISDKVALVQRMFPSVEARAAILKNNVTSQELTKYLAPYADELFDITPGNFDYAVSNIGQHTLVKANNALNNQAAKVFRFFAAAENPIRYAAFDKVAIDTVARKVKSLVDQGIDITPEQLNAIRQSAGREALQELEKTVYTVNNRNRLLHSLRAVMAFPTASANAVFRYGRLAAIQPVRTAGFVYNYGRAFQTFGVDENGNPTNDVNKMTHLIIPGTKDMNIGYKKQGVALNAQSLGFLLNRPSPSFITSVSLGTVLSNFPTIAGKNTEKAVEDFLTFGGTNWYKVLYPYGVPSSLKDSYKNPSLNSLYNAVVGPESKTDYINSWKSVYNYHALMVENGIESDMPTDTQIRDEVRALWFHKFASTFMSAAGVPYKVDTDPMGMTTRLYYKLQDKYLAMNYSSQQARDAAGEEMLQILGPKFMVDRVSFTGSNKNLNIPASYEAYKRVFEDNKELVGVLANIDPGNIGLVGLLTSDLTRNPIEQSNNILALLGREGLRLPGTSKRINEFKLTPQEIEAERLKQRTWNHYGLIRDALEAKITDGKTLRGHPELKAVLDGLIETSLRAESQDWYNEYQLSASGDTSYKYAKAFSEIIKSKPALMNNSKYWNDVQYFMGARTAFVQVYQSLPDYDPRKALYKDAYNNWVASNVGQWDGNFQTVVKRYFDNDSLKAVN